MKFMNPNVSDFSETALQQRQFLLYSNDEYSQGRINYGDIVIRGFTIFLR